MADEEYGFKQVREDMNSLKDRPRGLLYFLAGMGAVGSVWIYFNTLDLKANDQALLQTSAAIFQKQNELETICNSNGQLHIRDVVGEKEDDVYLEADGKRFFLYIDGKVPERQPDAEGYHL